MTIEQKCDEITNIFQDKTIGFILSAEDLIKIRSLLQDVQDIHKKEKSTILDAIQEKASIASMEYTLGEYNYDNEIGNKKAEEYRKDMNEGKCFAYGDCRFYVEQTFDGNYKVVKEELEIAKNNASTEKIEDMKECDLD